MFCPKCGAQLPDGTKFCPKCGAQIAAPGPANAGPATTAPANPTPAPQPASVLQGSVGTVPVYKIVIMGLAVLAMIFTFFTPAFTTDSNLVSASSYVSDAGTFLENLSGTSLGASGFQFKEAYSWFQIGDYWRTVTQYESVVENWEYDTTSISAFFQVFMWVVFVVAALGVVFYFTKNNKIFLRVGLIILVLTDVFMLILVPSNSNLTPNGYFIFGLILAIAAFVSSIALKEGAKA